MKRFRAFFLLLFAVVAIGGVGYYIHYMDHSAERTQQAQKKRTKKQLAARKAKLQSKIDAQSFSHQSTNGTATTTSHQNPQITKLLKSVHFVGTALVINHGKPIYRKAFGYANKHQHRKNTADSVYQIDSVQKSLTASLVMKLVQEGKIKLDDHLDKYYPTIDGGKQITLRRMLDMDSGLSMKSTGSSKAMNEAGVVNYAVENVQSDPNKIGQWNYQPVNYVLLSGIIRKVTGQSYHKYFTDNIIKKLGLKHTGFIKTMKKNPNRTTGYGYKVTQIKANYAQKGHETKANMANELGTGQIYMSAGDLYHAEQAILTGKIISEQNVNILHTAATTSGYGGGVYLDSQSIRSHGIGYGYEASVFESKDGQNGVVLLSNYYRAAATMQPAGEKLFTELLAGNL